MKTQTIGIEIEMTGISRAKAAEVIAAYLEVRPRRTHDSYDSYEIKARDGRVWKIMSDSSIQAKRKINGELQKASDEYKAEFVSPILKYEDIESLQEMIRLLRKAGAISSSELQCGIHVHIGLGSHTPNTLKNLVNLMASKEELIYKSLEVAPERITWCNKVNKDLLENINKEKPKTMQEFANLWYKGYESNRNGHYNRSRYHGLNLHSTFTKGTIEFRLFNGTLHAGKIRTYIVFCLALSQQALAQKSASPRRTETDNEKYTFRCWLLRLGLIGEEYKNCREHLMKNLTGDAAWRVPRNQHETA